MRKRVRGLGFRGLVSRRFVVGGLAVLMFVACDKPSRVEAYRAEKHQRDSIALTEQERSMAYYQSQLEVLQPKADSLLPLFAYEKNAKYQDHGYYVATGRSGVRVKVRDDGKQPILIYREGKRQAYPDQSRFDCPPDTLRLKGRDLEVVQRAEELQVVMADIKELEKRIARTSLEINKYQKRLDSR